MLLGRMSLRSFFLFFLALPSLNADVISLIQKGLSLEFEEAQMDINEIVPEDNLNYESEYESSSSSESSMTRGLLDSRLNKDDRAILTALRSIEDMDTNLATYIDPADVTLPCSIALSSSRINFLSSVLYDKAVEASEVRNRGIDKVDFLREWAASIVSNGADSIQQTLFNIDYLFENIVGDVGNQLRQSSQSNPAHLSAFLQFMRSLQLKGHILWGVALDIITDDEDQSLKPLEDFAVKSARQQGKVSFKDNVMKIFGGGVTVGIKTMLYQSYLRCSDKFDDPINTQSRFDDWEEMTIEPVENGFHIRTHFGTYAQAVEGEEMPVIQTRNKNDIGTLWRAEFRDSPLTVFGAVRGIKTAHGSYWAEGRTRVGKSVMTTTDKTSKLTAFSIIPVSDIKSEIYIVSPTGKYATYNPLTSKITLEEEPSIYSEFAAKSIDDKYIGLLTGDGQWIMTPPGRLGSVQVGKGSGNDGQNAKIERFSPPTSFYQIVSEFGTVMQSTGPPVDEMEGSNPIVTATATGLGVESKWEFEAGSGNIDGLLKMLNDEQ